MNHSTRDSQPGTSRATSKDIYPATWTSSAIKSDFEPSRHHRSASGYPSGPDYVSSSRRHGEKSSSARDHRLRNVSEGQPIPPPTSYTHYREPSYADAAHIRSSHRKESTADSAAYTSASKRYAHDSTAYRNNHSAEDVIQYPRANNERWIPPNPPSPPSHQPEPHNRERGRDDRERDKHKQREGYHRERRDESDVKERHKRRHDEGDSEWDKERERRDRRDRERHKEWEKDKSKEQERERVKEEFVERAREKTVRERTRGPERHRDERGQERYTEKERQRAVEKEKGREKDRDKERRRQKEREREQDREGERKDKEKSDSSRLKIGLDRERRDREVALPEREYWPEVEKGRESDREFDRRKRKVEWELQREREKAREGLDRGDVMQNGRRREVEHEELKKVQETSRRYQAAFPVEGGLIPSVFREQDIERARRSKKDIDSSRQKEHERIYKASEQSETERARYTDKENVARREHKSHYERTKPGGRPYADRAIDSERENPSHREAGVSNISQRETVLRGSVEPEPTNVAVKSSIVASKHPRDERTPYISSMGHGAIAKSTAPEPVPFSDVSRPTTATGGYMGHIVPASRLIDQTSSATPKHSPISAAGADSPKLDVGVSDARVKQGSSSQRALRRQSKMSYPAPEPVAVLPPSHATYKHGQSHVAAPQVPPSHVFRADKEDVTRLNSAQAPVDSSPNLLPPMSTVVPTKIDPRIIIPSTIMHRTTFSSQNINGSRLPGRNPNVTVPLTSVQDKVNIETSQIISRDARDNTPPHVQISVRTISRDARDNAPPDVQVSTRAIPRDARDNAPPDVQMSTRAIPRDARDNAPPDVQMSTRAIPRDARDNAPPDVQMSIRAIPRDARDNALPDVQMSTRTIPRDARDNAPPDVQISTRTIPRDARDNAPPDVPTSTPTISRGASDNASPDVQTSTQAIFRDARDNAPPDVQVSTRTIPRDARNNAPPDVPTSTRTISRGARDNASPDVQTSTRTIPGDARDNVPPDVPRTISRDARDNASPDVQTSTQTIFRDARDNGPPDVPRTISRDARDNASPDVQTSTQTIIRDARDNGPPDVQLPTRTGNDSDARQKTSALPITSHANADDTVIGVNPMHQVTSEQITPRPVSRSQIDKLTKHSGPEFDPLMSLSHSVPSTSGATSHATIRTGSKGIVKTSNATPILVTDPETKLTATERSRTDIHPGLPAVPLLEAQQEDPKREIGLYPHKLQSSSEIPFHRPPPSAAGWINQQESIKDKVSAASTPTGLAAHYAERSVVIEGQLTSAPASTIRRPATGLFVSKQEGPFSRVPTKTPIPEIASTSAVNHPPSDVPFGTTIQRNITTSDGRSRPESNPAPPMNSRSISESVGPAAFSRPQGPGDESTQKRRNIIDPHRSADSECVLSDQRGGSYGRINVPHSQDQPHLESSQSHSPAASLRRNAPVQAPPNMPSNVADFVQGLVKPQTANHSRNYSSSAKAGEDIVLVASHPLPPKPIEDMYIRGAPNSRQSDIGTPPTRDSHVTARARNDRTLDADYHTEREITMSTTHSIPANGAAQINQLDSTLSTVFEDKNVKSALHSHHTEHRRSPKTSHQIVDDAAHENESLRKQWKEATADKKTQSHAVNSSPDVNPPEVKQGKSGTSHPPEDKKPAILHEGLARILDQPLDRHIKKTRASPSTQSSQSGLPREELQISANEHDRRQPFSGTPRIMPRSSPSTSHKTPSPIVKTLNNPHSNQENHSKETYHRSNASATEYPHSIYRSSSVYPTVSTSTSHVLHEPSKNQAQLSHSLPVHGSLNSSTIEIIHPSDSSPYHVSTITSHPLIPTAYNQRPSVIAAKNSDPTSIKFPQPQPKAQSAGSRKDIAQLHQSKVPDISSNHRTLDPVNDRPALNEAGRTENGSHNQESSLGITLAASLLFSKSMDHHGSLEQKDSIVNPVAISNHPVKGTDNAYTSSPTSQELERHEPRLITPRIQKHAELSEETRRKSHSLDVAKPKPPEEGHKKSVSLDTKSQEPPQTWYPSVSYCDNSNEGKNRPQLTAVTDAVAQKNVPTTLSVNDDRDMTGVEQVKPGRKSPNITNMKVYRYLREKRNRTVSAMSMEAQDGTAPNTVVGSPTASVISQAPPIYVPSPRDPMKAAQDWLTEGIEAAVRADAQGRRRILRPGVVFDVAEDPPPDEQRHRSKRPRAPNKR